MKNSFDIDICDIDKLLNLNLCVADRRLGNNVVDRNIFINQNDDCLYRELNATGTVGGYFHKTSVYNEYKVVGYYVSPINETILPVFLKEDNYCYYRHQNTVLCRISNQHVNVVWIVNLKGNLIDKSTFCGNIFKIMCCRPSKGLNSEKIRDFLKENRIHLNEFYNEEKIRLNPTSYKNFVWLCKSLDAEKLGIGHHINLERKLIAASNTLCVANELLSVQPMSMPDCNLFIDICGIKINFLENDILQKVIKKHPDAIQHVYDKQIGLNHNYLLID